MLRLRHAHLDTNGRRTNGGGCERVRQCVCSHCNRACCLVLLAPSIMLNPTLESTSILIFRNANSGFGFHCIRPLARPASAAPDYPNRGNRGQFKHYILVPSPIGLLYVDVQIRCTTAPLVPLSRPMTHCSDSPSFESVDFTPKRSITREHCIALPKQFYTCCISLAGKTSRIPLKHSMRAGVLPCTRYTNSTYSQNWWDSVSQSCLSVCFRQSKSSVTDNECHTRPREK